MDMPSSRLSPLATGTAGAATTMPDPTPVPNKLQVNEIMYFIFLTPRKSQAFCGSWTSNGGIVASIPKTGSMACIRLLGNVSDFMGQAWSKASVTQTVLDHQDQVYTSTIKERKTQHHVKFNVYAQHIAKRFCTINPNEPDESFDTASLRIPKRHIDVSYAMTVATHSPRHAPPIDTYTAPVTNADLMDMSLKSLTTLVTIAAALRS
jgi:hypothetical protein